MSFHNILSKWEISDARSTNLVILCQVLLWRRKIWLKAGNSRSSEISSGWKFQVAIRNFPSIVVFCRNALHNSRPPAVFRVSRTMTTTPFKPIPYRKLGLPELAEEVSKLRSAEYDAVERAGKLGLPLVLGAEHGEDFKFAFRCALAELAVCHETSDLQLLLLSHFNVKTLDRHFPKDRKTKRWNLIASGADKCTPNEKKTIIGIVYPWFSESMYLSLARIGGRLKIDNYQERYEGCYRYFRSYPEGSHFKMSDGYVMFKFDLERNMIAFGQIARMHADFNDKEVTQTSNTMFEHRGFVIPTDSENLTLLSFREGTIRTSIIKLFRGKGTGIVLTATRRDGRAFAARALVSREGTKFFSAKIKVIGKFLDPNDPAVSEIETEMANVNDETIFLNKGWMWGR